MHKFSQLAYNVCLRHQTFHHFYWCKRLLEGLSLLQLCLKCFQARSTTVLQTKICICSCISKQVLFVHLIRSACILLQIHKEKVCFPEER